MRRVVIITGAYSGLGLELSSIFAANGFKLAVSGRDGPKLSALARRLRQNTDVISIKADVRKMADCRRIIEKTVATFGRVDLLINNAGVLSDTLDPGTVDKIVDTNLKGVIWCATYALDSMLKRGGTIVNIGSTSGVRFKPVEMIYGSSKFGVVGYSGNIHLKYGNRVGVICFCPGGMKTNLFRNDPERVSQDFMNPEKVATILFGLIKKGESGLFVLERDGTLRSSDFSLDWNWKSEKREDVS